MIPNTVESFWDKVDKSGGSVGCWLWKAATDREGYGFFWWKNKQIRATRFIFGVIQGRKIDGLQVCHHPY